MQGPDPQFDPKAKRLYRSLDGKSADYIGTELPSAFNGGCLVIIDVETVFVAGKLTRK